MTKLGARSVIAGADLKITQGKNVPVVSVEDLIWMKLISEATVKFAAAI